MPVDRLARAAWAVILKFDLRVLYEKIVSVEIGPWAPDPDQAALLALRLISACEGVGAARELDHRCPRGVLNAWLCGGVGTNHTCLALFGVRILGFLEGLLATNSLGCRPAGLTDLEIVTADGRLIRANAGAASFRSSCTFLLSQVDNRPSDGPTGQAARDRSNVRAHWARREGWRPARTPQPTRASSPPLRRFGDFLGQGVRLVGHQGRYWTAHPTWRRWGLPRRQFTTSPWSDQPRGVVVSRPVDTADPAPESAHPAVDPLGWALIFRRVVARELPTPDTPIWPPPADWSARRDAVRALNGALLDPEVRTWLHEVYAWSLQVALDPEVFWGWLAAPLDRAPRTLAAQQHEAEQTWLERGVLKGAWPWDPSSEALIDRLMNGMCPAEPCALGLDRGRLCWPFSWTADGDDAVQDGVYAGTLPDLRVWAHALPLATAGGPRYAGTPVLEAIEVRWPGEVGFTRYARPPVEDPSLAALDAWSHAKRLVRQAILVAGQIDWHVARCHFFAEQRCIAVCAALGGPSVGADTGIERHDLFDHLWPFLRAADEINAFGEEALFREKGLLAQASPLSMAGVLSRLRDHMGAWDAEGFAPRRPLCEADRFGRAGQIAWAGCLSWAQEVLLQVDSAEGGAAPSSAVPSSAAPSLHDNDPWARLDAAMREVAVAARQGGRSGALPPGCVWLSQADAPLDPRRGAPCPAGAVRLAWAPPTTAAARARFLAHAVWCATFLHSWIGGEQLPDAGHVGLAAFGYRWQQMPSAADAADPGAAWEARGPLVAHAGLQLALAEMLGATRWGDLGDAEHEALDNEKLPPALLRLLAHLRAAEDAAPPVDNFRVDQIRGRINV